jgi:ABC-type transport system involved in multi-copper enzyme maturation permease subunit
MSASLALARLTAVDLLRQPATWLALTIGAALLGLSLLFGMFSFDETDRMRMLCSAGIAVHALVALFIGVVGATIAVHRELADRTALTLLAKPLSRGAFLIGKSLGVLAAVALCGLLIALLHIGCVYLGSITGFEFDRMGHSHRNPEDFVAIPWLSLLGGHILALAQAACLTSLAVVLALRLGLAGNIIACFGAWIVAHLLPQMGLHGALVLPALDLLAADDAAQVEGGLPLGTVGVGLLYTGLWCSGALALGLALFERQDIP